MSNDFGFTEEIQFIAPPPNTRELAKELEGLIMPFLNKLKENPDQDIHWPNRVKAIDKQITKIKAVLDRLS